VLDSGEAQKGVIRPDFNRAIMVDFQGAKITSDVGFLLVREIDERFKIIEPMQHGLEDLRSPTHTRHSIVQMVRQRVYQIAAGYEDCNDADYLRIDPALRLAIGKDHKVGAGQSMLSRLENDVLGNVAGLTALEAALTRLIDALLRRKNKHRLIIDLDSTEKPTHGKQEGVAYNGHFAKNCFHPLFGFTSEGDCLGARRGRGMFIPSMASWSSSSPSWSATGPGSSFSGLGATPPLPNLKSTSIVGKNASPTSSG
jgi:hypothetical protein